jgi:hypothetical protein
MKYLFFLLVLVNLVFFLWETGIGRSPKQKDNAQSSSEERIVMVKELPKPSVAPALEETKPVTTPPPTMAPTPAPTEPHSQPAAAPQENTAAAPAVPDNSAQSCYRLGPYDSPRKAQAALRSLASRQAQVVKSAIEAEKGFLVVYPAAESTETARANLKMLSERGLKDLWLIQGGENHNAISLAAVSDKSRAEQALERFHGLGIEAEIKPRLVTSEQWWLETHEEGTRASFASLIDRPTRATAGLAVKTCDASQDHPN